MTGIKEDNCIALSASLSVMCFLLLPFVLRFSFSIQVLIWAGSDYTFRRSGEVSGRAADVTLSSPTPSDTFGTGLSAGHPYAAGSVWEPVDLLAPDHFRAVWAWNTA